MSFDQLLNKLSPTMHRIAFKVSKKFNSSMGFCGADDLYQEAAIFLWNSYNDGKLRDKTDSYMLQGCFFHLSNYMRTAQNKKNVFLSIDASINDDKDISLEEILPSSNKNDYINKLDNKLLIDKIRNNGLTSKEKEVFNLSIEGLTLREIGRRMGISHVMVIKLRNNIREAYMKYYAQIR